MMLHATDAVEKDTKNKIVGARISELHMQRRKRKMS